MTWRHLGESFDARVGSMAERTARRMTRRNALRTAVVGGAAGIAAVTIGQMPASANSCTSNCGPTPRCSGCPADGCPSGYSLCKGSTTSNCFNEQRYRCEWPSGQWVACTGLGHGYGYEICKDCKGPGGCTEWCTCLTNCICCQCLAPADFKAEQLRMQVSEAS
jgi:hypothetical protein